MRFIGTSIQEAIDWAQDYLATTRPLAERTLFSLIADKKMRETRYGYVLLEDDSDVEKRHTKMKSTHGNRPAHGQHGGYRFHKMRRVAKNVKHKMNNRKRYVQKIRHVQEQLNVDADADVDVAGSEDV